jgi:transcriptional regulator with XRE-family HTH domain
MLTPGPLGPQEHQPLGAALPFPSKCLLPCAESIANRLQVSITNRPQGNAVGYVPGMESDASAKEFLRRVGARLRSARESKSRTLDQAAQHLGMKTRATVGHWENGVNPIDLSKLYRLARYYETTVSALISDGASIDDAITTLERIRDAKPLEAAASPQAGQDALGIRHFKPAALPPTEPSAKTAGAGKAPRTGKQQRAAAPKQTAAAGRKA